MVNYRRSRIANAPYFLTLTLRNRNSSLLVDHIAALREAFGARQQLPFRTVAMAVLPEHLHWLCTLPEGDADFSNRVRMIKRSFTLRLLETGVDLHRDRRGEYLLWQPRFWEHTIRNDDDLQRHVDYIHYNPVRHGLVRAARDWPYSTFHRFVEQGLLDEMWGSNVTGSEGGFGERV